MTTFTLALGVSGTLTYSKTYKLDTVGDFARIRCNPLEWRLQQHLFGARSELPELHVEILAGVARSGGGLPGGCRALQQPEVDRRLLAYRGQWSRALLQRQ
jgi:hypothetical protein